MTTEDDADGNSPKWWEREAVRVRGYAAGTAVVGLLVLRDIVTNEEASYLLMALSAVLGVYGIESSRSRTRKMASAVVRDEVIPAARRGNEDTTEQAIQPTKEDRDDGL